MAVSGLGTQGGCKGHRAEDKVTMRPRGPPSKPSFTGHVSPLPQSPLLLLSMLFPDSSRKNAVKASHNTAQRG